MTRPRHVLVALAVLGAGACGDDGPAPIDRIEVEAAGSGVLEVMKGRTLDLEATAFAGEEPRPDVEIRYASETPAIVTVDSLTGVVEGLAFGDGRIAVSAADELTTEVTVRVVGEPVATVEIAPADTAVVVEGAVELVAVARDSTGLRLPGTEFFWSSESPDLLDVAMVAQNGLVTGRAPGSGTVGVETWNGVSATAAIEVLPVTGLAPGEGAFGTRVTLRGSGLPTDPGAVRLAFPAGGGELVEAENAVMTGDSVVAWVPVGAESGHPVVTLDGGSAALPASFTVTGNGDDAFEENDDPAFSNPEIGVGFRNPELVAAASSQDSWDEDWYMLPVDGSSGEFTVQIDVRKGSGFDTSGGQTTIDSLLHAFLYRLEGGSTIRLVSGHPSSGALSWSFVTNSEVRTLRFARRVAEPDTFFLRVLGRTTDMPYALEIVPEGRWAFGPDAFEENDGTDRPAPAALAGGVDAVAENGSELDYYSFEVMDSATVTVELRGGTGDLDLWVGRPDSSVVNTGISRETGSADETLVTEVTPGTWVVGVWEFGMLGSPYTISVTSSAPGTPGGGVPAPGLRSGSKATLLRALTVPRPGGPR